MSQMSSTYTNDNNRMNCRAEMSSHTSAKQINAQTQRNRKTDGRKNRQTLAEQAAKRQRGLKNDYIQPTNLAVI